MLSHLASCHHCHGRGGIIRSPPSRQQSPPFLRQLPVRAIKAERALGLPAVVDWAAAVPAPAKSFRFSAVDF
jgi:hypothetical protein